MTHRDAGDGDAGLSGAAAVARVRLRVAPGSRTAQIVGRYGEGWKVRVRAAPEQGRANAEVCTLIAGVAGVPSRDVEVVVGTASRDKLVAVTGLQLDVLAQKLDAASAK